MNIQEAVLQAFALDDTPLPGRDFDPATDDLMALRPVDGVTLGGYFDGDELPEFTAPGSDMLVSRIRYVHQELLRRVREKIDRATGEVVWLRRPAMADDDGCIVRLDPATGRWLFYMRAYFFAPGVEPTLREGGPIEFVRAPRGFPPVDCPSGPPVPLP